MKIREYYQNIENGQKKKKIQERNDKTFANQQHQKKKKPYHERI